MAMCRIALDAMGGDHAPAAEVEGALMPRPPRLVTARASAATDEAIASLLNRDVIPNSWYFEDVLLMSRNFQEVLNLLSG